MTEREYRFYGIKEVTEKGFTERQQEALFRYMEEYGYRTLAGLSSALRARQWTYYDVLEVESP